MEWQPIETAPKNGTARNVKRQRHRTNITRSTTPLKWADDFREAEKIKQLKAS